MNTRDTRPPKERSSTVPRQPALPTVLMVDDQPARLLTYESILEGVGVRCVRALSGEEALGKLLRESFAVILLDVNMPDMDGFEVARMIREHPRCERTPIIFITGVNVTELDRLKGYQVGAIDYIAVPIVPEILRSKVALLVELYQRRAELESVNHDLRETRAELELEKNRVIASSQAQLSVSEARYRAIFENPTTFTVVLRLVVEENGKLIDAVYTDANERALTQLSRKPSELIGQTITAVMGECTDAFLEMCATVRANQKPLLYEVAAGGAIFSMSLFMMDAGTAVSSGVDITSRIHAEQRTQLMLESDRAEKEWLAALLGSMNEEVYFTDTTRRYSYVNAAAQKAFGSASAAGADVEEYVSQLEVYRLDGSPRPLGEAPPLRSLNGEVIRQEEQLVRHPLSGEIRHRQVSSAPVRNAAGAIVGAVSVVRDVTEQRRTDAELRRRDQRSSALIRLADAFRSLEQPSELAYAAARVLAETLSVDRCGYGVVDPVAETITIERDWNAPGVHSLAGTLHFREYGSYIEALKRGETVICTDATRDARTAGFAQRLKDINAVSFVNMPLVENGKTTALLYMNHSKPREWPEQDLAFMYDVAERTRNAVERRRVQLTLEADLKVTRLLRDLAARTVVANDLTSIFHDILAAAVAIAEADGGTLQLLDVSSSELFFAATQGLDLGLVQQFERVSACSGSPCGVALASQVRSFVDFDVPAADDPDGSLRAHFQAGLRSAQSTPLVSRSGRTLGMVSTHWCSAKRLAERELRYLDLLARQAADLIERTDADKALRASEQELREAGQVKDEFIAMLAHELRNPLVPIRAGVELLRKEESVSPTIKAIRPIMERQIAHMVRLIDDLLDVSRMTLGKIELRRRSVSLNHLIDSAVELHQGAIAAANLTLVRELSDGALSIDVDPMRFSQILSNILQNAVKFTPVGGRVTIKTAVITGNSAERVLRIAIADTGVGIAADALPRIFELFGQARNAGITSNSGLGIGLALARRLTELHGGTLEGRSAGANHGSEFIIRLPIPGAESNPEVVAAANATGVWDGLRILIIDDNRDGAEIMGMLVEEQGATASMAFNGPSGIGAATAFDAQIVLLDIGMPGMDGYEVCRRLRQVHGDTIGIIAITGWGHEKDKKTALAAGFDAHLTKPVDPVVLATTIAQIIPRLSIAR